MEWSTNWSHGSDRGFCFSEILDKTRRAGCETRTKFEFVINFKTAKQIGLRCAEVVALTNGLIRPLPYPTFSTEASRHLPMRPFQ